MVARLLRHSSKSASLFVVLALVGYPLAAQDNDERLAVRALKFDGNRAIDDFTLRMSIVTSESAWLARVWPFRLVGFGERRYFNENEFRRDVLRLLLLYRRSGFIDATVDTIVTREPGQVGVRFVITEGDPVLVESLAVRGMDGIVPINRLIRDLPLKTGEPFDRARLISSTDSIRSALKNRGYPFPEVYRSFSVENAARAAQVEFLVDPGPRAWIDSIDVIGPPGLQAALVRKVLRVQPGQQFNQRALYQSQQELYRTGVFDFVDVRLADTISTGPDDSLVTVQVQVSQGRLHRVRLGAGYGTSDCFRTLTSWTIRNFLGGGRSLDLSAGFSKIGTGAPFDAGFENTVCRSLKPDAGTARLDLNYNLTAGLRFPTVFSPRRSATVSLSAERFSEFQAYVRDAVGVTVAVTQQTRWNIPLTFSYSLSYGKTLADDAVFCSILNVCKTEDAAIFKQPRVKSTTGALLVSDRTNSPLNPTRGTVLTLEGRFAGEAIGSDRQIEFAKGVGEFSSYHLVGRRAVFAWRVRWGSILSPDTFERQDVRFVPTEERFYGGGSNTVRGFRQNELGPLVHVEETVDVFEFDDSDFPDTTIVDTLVSPTGGNQMVFGNVEIRFPLSVSGRVGGVVFVDAGQVFAAQTAGNRPGIRVTPGVGLRIFTPLGPVRFDLAYNPHGSEKGPLFARTCETRPTTGRTCDAEAPLKQPDFSRPTGNGLFGLGERFDFLRRLRVNFSIGQAF